MRAIYGTDSMPETGENVARECQVERAAQDAFAWRSQMRVARAAESGFFADEIVAVEVPAKGPTLVTQDDAHGRIRRSRNWLR